MAPLKRTGFGLSIERATQLVLRASNNIRLGVRLDTVIALRYAFAQLLPLRVDVVQQLQQRGLDGQGVKISERTSKRSVAFLRDHIGASLATWSRGGEISSFQPWCASPRHLSFRFQCAFEGFTKRFKAITSKQNLYCRVNGGRCMPPPFPFESHATLAASSLQPYT